jgi:DNA-binding NarL/FixJ family response regulator
MHSVLIGDDHPVVRAGLRLIVDGLQPEFSVLAEAGDGRSLVEAAAAHRPDLVLVDVTMPDLNGVEATRQILERSSRTRVIAVTMHKSQRQVTEMLRAGAKGYLLKGDPPGLVHAALRAVVAGGTFLSPNVSTGLVALALGREVGAPSQLSPREREVLQLIAEGSSTKAIAIGLGLSVKTVDTHRKHIMKKLAIDSVAGLTKYAIREGLTEQ